MQANAEKVQELVDILSNEQVNDDVRAAHLMIVNIIRVIAMRAEKRQTDPNKPITLATLVHLLSDNPGYGQTLSHLMSEGFLLDVILEAARDPRLIEMNERPPAVVVDQQAEELSEEVVTN
jgi:hypothetical protein